MEQYIYYSSNCNTEGTSEILPNIFIYKKLKYTVMVSNCLSLENTESIKLGENGKSQVLATPKAKFMKLVK